MNEPDEIDENANNAFRTRKAKVKKAFNEGKLMQEEFDDGRS